MANYQILLGGDVDKYTAELWNRELTTKVADIPLGVAFTVAGGATESVANIIILRPIGGATFDRIDNKFSLSQPWNSGPEFRPSDTKYPPVPSDMMDTQYSQCVEKWLANVIGSPIAFDVFLIGKVITATPFNRLHLMDEKALKDFASVRLIETDENGSEIFNYSQYIINLLQIGFKLPEDDHPDQSTIRLGQLTTNITTPLFNKDDVKVNLGIINIPAANSSIDYYESKLELYLPFVADPIELNQDLVIGKALRVEYVLDLYSGDVTVNLYAGSDVPFDSSKTTIGRNVPIRIATDSNYTITGAGGVINGVMAAYVRHSKPELVEGQFYNLVSKEGLIGNYKGYLEVENIELSGKALADEKQQIQNILRNGVIIK